MKVGSLMNPKVETVRAEDDLAKTAMLMWRKDCGFAPVVDESNTRVVGVITDRDICMATATKHEAPEAIAVRDTMASQVHFSRVDDDIESALGLMKERQVHRLPVLDGDDRLAGVISFSDVVREATLDGRIRSIGDHDLVTAYRTIKSPRLGDAVPAQGELGQ